MLPRLPCVPRLFQEGRWGAHSGWGAPGCPAGRSRVPPSPPPPLLQREFQSERARGLLPGRNHPAQRRGVGRRHLTARPRPPRVRGGGSVCSVTNGPSRPARPLARARRGPARDRSSQQMPGSHRPTRRPLSGHLGGHAQIPGHLSGCMEHPVIRPHGEAGWSLGWACWASLRWKSEPQCDYPSSSR